MVTLKQSPSGFLRLARRELGQYVNANVNAIKTGIHVVPLTIPSRHALPRWL